MFLKELLNQKLKRPHVERSLQVTISKITVTDGRASGPYDQVRAEKAVRELLLALGEDPDREGLKETPARVARAMKENFEGLWQSPEEVLTTTFDIGHEELVIVRALDFLTPRIDIHRCSQSIITITPSGFKISTIASAI